MHEVDLNQFSFQCRKFTIREDQEFGNLEYTITGIVLEVAEWFKAAD